MRRATDGGSTDAIAHMSALAPPEEPKDDKEDDQEAEDEVE